MNALCPVYENIDALHLSSSKLVGAAFSGANSHHNISPNLKSDAMASNAALSTNATMNVADQTTNRALAHGIPIGNWSHSQCADFSNECIAQCGRDGVDMMAVDGKEEEKDILLPDSASGVIGRDDGGNINVGPHDDRCVGDGDGDGGGSGGDEDGNGNGDGDRLTMRHHIDINEMPLYTAANLVQLSAVGLCHVRRPVVFR